MDEKRARCLGILPKDDDLIQILIRLPVVYLTQCKPVCKSWLALIESSIFTKLYTTFNSSSNSSSKFGSFMILASCEIEAPGFSPSLEHSLYAWSMPRSSSEDQQQQQQVLKSGRYAVPLRYKSLSFYRRVVGSCDGLVCLYDGMSNIVSLWNPVTKEHRFLPKPKDIGNDWPLHLVTFGLDVNTRDYKVVLLSCYRPQYWRTVSPIECISRVQVYSLSTDSWRLLDGITLLPGYPFIYMDEALCLNGSCFFMAKFFHTKQQPCFPESDRFIISFDLTTEIITTIQLPDHYKDEEVYLSYLGNRIAVFIKSGDEDYTIWLLNEQPSSTSCCCLKQCCLKQSWKKLSSFKIESGVRSIPRGISNDAEFAFLEVEDSTGVCSMKLYNLVTKEKEVKQDFLFCLEVMSKAFPYQPSLVSIIGGNGGSGSGTGSGSGSGSRKIG